MVKKITELKNEWVKERERLKKQLIFKRKGFDPEIKKTTLHRIF